MVYGRSQEQCQAFWANTYRTYFLILGDLPGSLLEAAGAQLMRRSKWFPTAAEVADVAFDLVNEAEGVTSANDAWAEVTRRIRKGGFYEQRNGWYTSRPPSSDDWSTPLVQLAIDGIGGWHDLRMSENRAADRARFIEAYNGYLYRQRERERMLPEVRAQIDQITANMRRPGLEPTNE
jgi:hypothetical protein